MTTPAPTSVGPTTAPPGGTGLAINDVLFNCRANNFAGFLVVTTDIGGVILSPSFDCEGELVCTTSISGSVPQSGLVDDGSLYVTTSISGIAVANDLMSNWVGWSKIGNVSFELDLVNDAGFKSMSWPGYVYKVIRLGKSAIVYGSGGVTEAFPVMEPAPTFGFKNILKVGIKNKEACTGDEFVHFCIDDLGCLYKISSEGAEVLGYEEFLRILTNPVLLWDSMKRRLYISDASTGYIYNDKALGGGFANLTGLYRVRGSLTAVAPADVVADPVHIVTEIMDLDQRGLKGIESLHWSAYSDEALQSAIDYRYRKNAAFVTSNWTTVNNEGVAHIKVVGVEFRFRLKSTVHGTFDLSRLGIQMKPIDRRYTRSLIGSTGRPIGGRD